MSHPNSRALGRDNCRDNLRKDTPPLNPQVSSRLTKYLEFHNPTPKSHEQEYKNKVYGNRVQ